jgi:hypothetical protein
MIILHVSKKHCTESDTQADAVQEEAGIVHSMLSVAYPACLLSNCAFYGM